MIPEPFSWQRENIASLWLSNSRSPTAQAFETYFEEHIGDDEGQPISEFARDTGLVFYDNDFLESDCQSIRRPLRELLAPFSFSSSWLAAALRAAHEAGVEEAHSAAILFNCDYANSGLRNAADAPLQFIGSFPYQLGAPGGEQQVGAST